MAKMYKASENFADEISNKYNLNKFKFPDDCIQRKLQNIDVLHVDYSK